MEVGVIFQSTARSSCRDGVQQAFAQGFSSRRRRVQAKNQEHDEELGQPGPSESQSP
jgi:hypothetical protein